MTYQAPVPDIIRAMANAAGRDRGFDQDNIRGVLEEAGRFASAVLLPLDRVGDRAGVRLEAGCVTTAPGWRDAYRQWIAGGWNGLAASEEHGGMGLDRLLQAGCAEIWSAANLSFGLCPLLTASAIEALDAHGSPELRRRFLPKLVSGEWTGTMNLTEPQAGSDLSTLRTKAEPAGDGTFRIAGQKIYITFGDHDLTGNIVHLVLARLPDAAPGTRGISLFLVPKVIAAEDGTPVARNDVVCAGLERKLGLHGAPTCTMSFGENGGAVGHLVGEAGRGLNAMFTMMNQARLAVGLQGVGVAERATQQAVRYAAERRQGRAPGEAAGSASAIVRHPDVARMCMRMKSLTAAARALCYLTAAALDRSERADDPGERQAGAHRAALLTPIAKAFSTDAANEVASLNVQVHGGMGFIEDTGPAQLFRDVRITPIYEGTNGVQAIDLVARKLALDGGRTFAREMKIMRESAASLLGRNNTDWGASGWRLDETVEALGRATVAMREQLGRHEARALAGATAYLRLFALARAGVSLAEQALLDRAPQEDAASTAERGTVTVARFFAEQVAGEARGLATAIIEGSSDVDQWQEALVSSGTA